MQQRDEGAAGRETAGHVFVIQGDVRRLACDAWLLPADGRGRPRKGWLPPDLAGHPWPLAPSE